MVVRVDHVVAAFFQAEDFQGAVGDDLVGVHVGRSASAALDDVRDEMGIVVTSGDIVAGAGNGITLAGIDHAHGQIGVGGSLFDVGVGADQVGHFGHGLAADGEVFDGAGGMDAPVGFVGQVLGTQKITFLTHGGFFQ